MADLGHLETETLIKDLEARVRREYSQATKELTAKLDDYFRRFEVKDEKWRIMVANGEKTVEEYQKWRFGQMMVGKRWEDMRDTIAEDLHNTNLISRGMLTGKMPDAYALNHNWTTYDIERAGRVNTGYTLYSKATVERLLVEDPELLKPPGVQMKKTFADWDAYINKDLGNIEDQIGQIRAAYPQGNMPAGVQTQLNRLESEKRSFDKLMADGKDIRWQKGQIQSVTLQAVLQGESIPNMARRIAKTMGEMNRKASVRYARTAMTSAQNGGRRDAYKRAQGLGINLQQEWIATLDFRTRHAHRQLDGQIRDIDEPFQVDGYDLEFPGDPAAPGYLVYNCRCTTAAKVAGWDSMSGKLRSDEAIEGMSYEEWKEGHSQPQDILNQQQTSEAMRQRTIRDLYSGESQTEPKKPEFTPAKTREEAEEYAKKFAENVDYSGISVDNCNKINKTLDELTEKYPTNKLEKLGHKPRKRNASATACYDELNISRKLDKSLDNTAYDAAHKERTRKMIQDIQSRYPNGRIPPDIKRQISKLESSLNFDRWTVSGSKENHLEAVITHEYGHILSDQYFGMINEYKANPNYANDMRLRQMSQNWRNARKQAIKNGDIYKISEYAKSDDYEFFAECFAARELGETLPTYVEELMTEVLNNGIM